MTMGLITCKVCGTERFYPDTSCPACKAKAARLERERLKLAWVRRLRAGDVVCDCRCRHLRIAELYDRKVVRMPPHVRRFVYWDCWPDWVVNVLDDVAFWACDRLGYTSVEDRDITLEDGSCCSAFHCCDPADDHFEADHWPNDGP